MFVAMLYELLDSASHAITRVEGPITCEVGMAWPNFGVGVLPTALESNELLKDIRCTANELSGILA